jgi:ABC-type multidrug transport system ATPase subunit
VSDALVFDGVVKRYARGAAPALDGMSFRVPRGVVCGLVGPNGAGKTTTFSVLSGFLPPDAGTVDILGLGPFDPWTMKGRLGVLPQDAELPDRQTPVELLTHLARLQGIGPREAAEEAARRVEEVRLGDRARSRIGALSHGMRRRVAVASALLGDPELVVLDEPTSGLDPVQARSLREVLAGLRGRRTVIVSSHNLLELELLCDWVVMVDRGRCLRQGSVAEVTGRGARSTWELAGPVDVDALRARLGACTVRALGDVLEIEAPEGVDLDEVTVAVMAELAAQRVGLRGLRRGVSLEDRFVGDAVGA